MKRALLSGFAAALCLAVGGVAAALAQSGTYHVHNLVSDQAGKADHLDPNLVNAWGLDALSSSPWWVADNGTDVSTLYNAAGDAFPPPPNGPLVVKVPAAPTGLVANSTSDFVVTRGTTSAPALFIFATEDGRIRGWNPGVQVNEATLAVNESRSEAIFKGLALASTPDGSRLYVTDFHNSRVRVYDGKFKSVNIPGAFTDPGIPEGYGPFGIQNVHGVIVVTYAKQDELKEDDVGGDHLGFVDAYDTSGKLLGRIATRDRLNAPWGIALAPANFGPFSGDLLIGNFGNGIINAFAKQSNGTWTWQGRLSDESGNRISIDGLWALQFGKGAANNGPDNTLFFTAGPDDESHGLFGSITANS
jgi:uncharacterized protein (TIGR03118 family)